jgi:hypothetical protein
VDHAEEGGGSDNVHIIDALAQKGDVGCDRVADLPHPYTRPVELLQPNVGLLISRPNYQRFRAVATTIRSMRYCFRDLSFPNVWPAPDLQVDFCELVSISLQ